MPGVRQASFAAGELAPGLWGRTDLKFYSAGARKINNFIPTYYGSLLSRPGTQYIATAKDYTAIIRLIPFNSSDETYQNYVLEFGKIPAGAGYIRFFQNGAPVMNGGNPYEISHSYAAADIPRLKFVQVGDILTIVHPKYQPMELKRRGHIDWTITVIDFTAPTGSLSYMSLYPGFTPPSGGTDATDRPKLEWDWVFTAIDSDGEESLPSEPFYELLTAGQTPFGSMVYKDRPKKFRLYANGAKSVFVYRGRHGLRGFIGVATQDPLGGPGYFSFLDEGQAPDYSKQPPDFRRRFLIREWRSQKIYYTGDRVLDQTSGTKVYECIQTGLSGDTDLSGTGSNIVDGAPDWQQSHVYGANAIVTANGVKWQTIAGGTSAGTGTGPVWDPTNPGAGVVDNSVTWQFITHWPAARWRYVGTNSPVLIDNPYPATVAIFEQRRIFGRTNQEPGDIFASRTDDYNNFFALGKDFSRELNIALATDALQFELASRRREEIRSLVGLRHLVALTNSSEWAVGGAANGDPMSPISISARAHSERGSSWLDPVVIGDILLHVQPKGTIVRDFYYDWRNQAYTGDDISFNSRHLFKSRDIVSWAYAEDPQSVVWAIQDNGQLLSLTYDKAQGISAWARHESSGASFLSVCTIPEGKEDSVYLLVGRTINGSYVQFIERMTTREISDIKLAMCLDAGISYYNATPFTTVSGLTHLNGEVVSALADGIAYENLTVSGGAITLPVAANQVQVGLPYTCEFESLDVGDAREKQKIVKETLIDLIASRGVYIAEALDSTNWSEYVRVPASGSIALEAGTARVTVFGAWGLAGRVAVQQRLPMPIEITGLHRELGVGGT